MNPKLYKAEKIKSGRPRCPHRERAAADGVSKYIDAAGVERWTSSGNATATKRQWETDKRRASGTGPRVPKAPPWVLSKKNIDNVKRWRAENPEKARAMRAKENFIRRSAVRGRTLAPVTAEFLIEQRQFQEDRCAYCVAPLDGGGHQDHVVPVSKGGAHAPFNIVWACEPCNLRKGAKLGWAPFWRAPMTDPFTLRPVDDSDREDLFLTLADENVTRYLGVKRLRTHRDTHQLIAQYQNSPSRWLAVRDLDGQFLGLIGLERQHHSVALTIVSNGHMQGFGRKVSVPLVETLFAQPGIRRVWAYCHIDNLPVQRVLTRMGAEREGQLRKFAVFPNLSDEPQDVYVYAIVR